MAADWKGVVVEGSKVTEELEDDRNVVSCTDEVGVSGEEGKMLQRRSSRKQYQESAVGDSGRSSAERVAGEMNPRSQRGRESHNAMKTPRPNDGEKDSRGVRNSSQNEETPSRRADEGSLEPATVTQQKGAVKDAGVQPQRTTARKTVPSAALNKKKRLINSLTKTNSKLTARKSGPTVVSKLQLSKRGVHFTSHKRGGLPVKFDFRRSGQIEVPKQRFAARKSYPVGESGVYSHSNRAQFANKKSTLTSLQPGPVQHILPSNSEMRDIIEQFASMPKQPITARKSCPTAKNQSQKFPSPRGSHKKPHQIRFANNRPGKIETKENGRLYFDISKSLKRNAAVAAENSLATKTLKSSPLTVPPVVQRAVMLGLVSTSSLRPGMIARRPCVDPDKMSLQTGQVDSEKVGRPASKEPAAGSAYSDTEKITPNIERNSTIEEYGRREINLLESPDSSQVDEQDVFVDDDPPKLISSRDLEAQDMSGSDETPELERQPPPDITSAEQLHRTLPSSGENQSTDRDNPTPIPGTTASSCNPGHAHAADFPVGAAGSATPDSSATEACPSDAIKKKKRPRTHTHFGMKRHRVVRVGNKLNTYDSDSTDVQSEAGSEVQSPEPKKQRTSSTSTMASVESEVDYMVQGNLHGHSSGNHHLQSELPLCCCRMEQNGPSSVVLSTCRALEVIDSELVECKNKINTGKLHRPSSRVPYGAFCSEHRTLMTEHKCCPGCGCFCTTGVVIVCNPDDKDGKAHQFHRECIVDMAGALYCPHCGSTAGLREVSIPSNGNMATLRKIPKSMIVSGVVKLPKSLLEKLTGCLEEDGSVATESKEDVQQGPRAKMSITSNAKPEPPKEEEECASQPSKSVTLRSGMTITSDSLPPGSRRDVLESAMEYLNTEAPKRVRFYPKNIYTASAQGDMGKVLQMLAEGFDPNYRFPTHNLETTLHPAAASGQLEIIVMLLQAGANMEAEDDECKTPLHLAVENGHNDCMRYLIKHGAVVEHKDDEGMTILHLAAKNGNFEAVKYIMGLRKINSNAQDDGGWTPIIWAAEYKHIPVVQYLIERGADPNIRDKEGNSGLHWAVFSGTEDVAEIFLNRHCDIHAPNIHGDTPLHIASRENNYGCVTMLLLRNANIEVTNQEGETPLDCAKANSDVALALQVNQKMKLAIGNRAIRTEKIISRDIARGHESLPIPVVNAVNDDPIPTDFHYVAKSCETKPLNINRSIKNPPMCTCTNEDCYTDSCECANNSVQCWYDSDGRLFPDFDYHEPPLIFECGPGCKCWRSCRNRVVQNGIRSHLQLYRTAKIGWGVRVTQDVPQGTFICEYAGELISDAEADNREDDSYLFDLDNEEREVYCIDARYYGNISRFINHLCDPNIVPVRVFIEHRDISFPRIAFFASRDIKAQEELGFDYGDKFWAIKSKFFTCCCGSVHCKHAEGASGGNQGDHDS